MPRLPTARERKKARRDCTWRAEWLGEPGQETTGVGYSGVVLRIELPTGTCTMVEAGVVTTRGGLLA